MSKTITLRLDEEIYRRFQTLAERDNRPLSNFIQTAAIRFVESEQFADEFEMDWQLSDSGSPKKVILMASKQSHCLVDLLHRWHSGELECDIPCVISNHDDLRSLVEWHGIPYFHVPVDKDNKAEHFRRVTEIVEEHKADTIVLARYMQILPPEICEQYVGQVINIHHSFLPSFVGAKPYHQAAERGVKLIGATCHYVTPGAGCRAYH